MDAFWAAPPISRTIAAAAFVLSLAVYYANIGLGYYVIFSPEFLLTIPPQVWRVVTSFLITEPQLGLVFDTYFLLLLPTIAVPGNEEDYPCTSDWSVIRNQSIGPVCGAGMVGSYLEKTRFDSSMVIRVGLNIIFTGAMVMTGALILAFAYTMSQDRRGQQTHFIVFSIPAVYLPYAMLLLTLLLRGSEAAKIQGTGLVAAHLHDFLTRIWPAFGGGRNLVPTPTFIKKLFDGPGSRIQVRTYGTAIRPSQDTVSSSGSSGPLPQSWRSRGTGHRLGGD
ncbi:hypothetical protein B7463_g2785, partial [Scytalidium lignicola]